MNAKQSAAMRILKAVGKQGGSALCIAEQTKIHINDIRRAFAILAKNNLLNVENDAARLSPKFLKDVPLWKEMKNAIMCLPELA